MDQFEALEIETGETQLAVWMHGAGPPLVLLHGFPETHLMWREIAPRLARDFTVVCPDLRGYGKSGCPASATDHAPYSKRAMARDVVAVMRQFGFSRFSVAGHDRGGRVAYRLAFDNPHAVECVAVLDVVPTATAWDDADDRFALGYWPWSLLAQPEPLPERILTASADAIVDAALGGWGTPVSVFPRAVRDAYVAALREPMHAHAICEEYRAAASLDRQHDADDRSARRKIAAPLLVLWSARGGLADWYQERGGPIAVWREWAENVSGHGVDAGHFFPEEVPDATVAALAKFFGAGRQEKINVR